MRNGKRDDRKEESRLLGDVDEDLGEKYGKKEERKGHETDQDRYAHKIP